MKASTTPEAVLTVVSQYLDEWSREEIAALPRGAWPGPLRSKSDVLEHALKLNAMHAGFAGEPAMLHGLHQLLLFFTHASVRITQLASVAQANAPAESLGKTGDRKPVSDGD